jgi:uncharacterized membrane-anchored protein
VAIAHVRFRLGAVLAFWSAYVLTRPLGASFGDYLTQSHKDGGLGLGTNQTSLVFVVVILGLVAYLTRSKIDAPKILASDSSTNPTSTAASTAEA